MHNCLTLRRLRQTLVSIVFFLLLLNAPQGSFAQDTKAALKNQPIAAPSGLVAPATESPAEVKSRDSEQLFRLERVLVQGGAELITIHARLDGIEASREPNWVPLVTILRDTLGDQQTENDRLRYVWPLTYTRPSTRQRLLGAVPFLYGRVGNKQNASTQAPPPVLDLAATNREVWNSIFWLALQNVLIDPYGTPVKASTRSYQNNITAYRKSHIIRALSVLSLYDTVEGSQVFSLSELSEIQARLRLTDKTFGGLVGDHNFERFNDKELSNTRDERGHNWELLRQRVEAESLLFEPLQMPDGSATHALVWVAKPALNDNRGKKYDGRFLNIASPWTDKRLLSWDGYTETRYFDAENRAVPAETPGARATEMIPLALYGLDNPKIPMVLVDFRDGLNPKRREMSRRALHDVTRNILSLSTFGDLPFFLGHTIFDFVTGRRGMDVNQPSRVHTYSQLKLLLSLNQSLDPELREQIGKRLEKVSLNPLENDLEAEARLAKQQYEALLAYAKRSDGLPAKLERDRRAEMLPLAHSRKEQIFFRAANILSFGAYTHREKATPDMTERLDLARRLGYHSRFLRDVARSIGQVDVAWNLADIKQSLQFISEHGAGADSTTAKAAAAIFLRTADSDTRRSCLDSLSRMTNPRAKSELLRLSQLRDVDQARKDLIISYLNGPPPTPTPIASTNPKPISARVDQ
ncbi:MAG: hypothetical protein H0U60_13095 [Blastocatellia bacterium]|nr:hypothetical protein [Blastocatellia bacterium]